MVESLCIDSLVASYLDSVAPEVAKKFKVVVVVFIMIVSLLGSLILPCLGQEPLQHEGGGGQPEGDGGPLDQDGSSGGRQAGGGRGGGQEGQEEEG